MTLSPLLRDPDPRALDAELDRGQERLTALLRGRYRELGAPDRLVEHLAASRLYLRVPLLLADWIEDDERRDRVADALGLHVLAMKLLDDVIDGDSGIEDKDLVLTAVLLQNDGLNRLCDVAGGESRIHRVLHEDFIEVCTSQTRAKQRAATDLASWCLGAEGYGSLFLACHGTLAAIGGGLPRAAPVVRSFAWNFAYTIMIGDDLQDYHRHGEREGNLGHLLRTGAVGARDVVAVLEKLRTDGRTAARALPTRHDLAPFVDRYVDDVLERILPAHLPQDTGR